MDVEINMKCSNREIIMFEQIYNHLGCCLLFSILHNGVHVTWDDISEPTLAFIFLNARGSMETHSTQPLYKFTKLQEYKSVLCPLCSKQSSEFNQLFLLTKYCHSQDARHVALH